MTGDSPEGPDGLAWRNHYGRVRGKTLRPAQKVALADDLGPLTLPGVSRAENEARTPLDLTARFGSGPVWVEVGFGGGEHLVAMASRYPDVALIGAEPFVNGVAMLLRRVQAAGVANLTLHPGDVRDLFDVLPAASIGRVFLNYPDPWPKARHHRRRFVTPSYLGPLARIMAPGAALRLATDIPDYVRQAQEQVPQAGFTLVPGPQTRPWDDWTPTRYEAKALREGRTPAYLTFLRAGPVDPAGTAG